MSATVNVNVSGSIATITLNRPRSLNALAPEDYDTIATALRDIDEMDNVIVTIWQAMGAWFCAGADVKQLDSTNVTGDLRKGFLKRVAPTTTDCSQALYSHRKILIAALNGPVMGIAAALLGQFDFVYSMPNAWLSVPFTFIGIIAEGGCSVSFVNKMGLGKANEVLIWGKKKDARELLECGFINKIFPPQATEMFHEAVRKEVTEELAGLDPTALLAMKRLIKTGLNEKNNFDAINLRESYEQASKFASGKPMEQFARLARKEIKHKL